MDNLVIFCKTFRRDIDKFGILLNSVVKHNSQKIKFYVSIPTDDIKLFVNRYGREGYIIIEEGDIYNCKEQSSAIQQVVKFMFWKLNLCKNYIVIDSDSFFIKDFYFEDFLYDELNPYTVMHEQKELFSWLSFYDKKKFTKAHNYFIYERSIIMSEFQRKGRLYDFGIWNSQVLRSLEVKYLKKNNINFHDLILKSPSELSWYGEWLLKDKTISIIPVEPLFKVFHYESQYLELRRHGVTESDIANKYLGIVMQSNWNSPNRFSKKKFNWFFNI